MDVIHFTQGATDPLNDFRAKGVRFLPLADGTADSHVSCAHLEPGATIQAPSITHAAALLVVHGCGARRMVESAALLVDEVLPEVPIRQWVLSVPFALRFLFASNPGAMGEALGIVYRAIAGFLIHKAGFTQARAQCGAITLIQRFGSALNLNVHFHMLIPDGVYLSATVPPSFRCTSPPTRAELQALVQRISERIARHLERMGLLSRDMESSYLDREPDVEDALEDLQWSCPALLDSSLFTLRRVCHVKAQAPEAICAGVSATNGRAGTSRAETGGAEQRIWLLGLVGPRLGQTSRS
jgi:hypothetical protein